MQGRKIGLIIVGFTCGFTFVSSLVEAVIVTTRYDLLPQPLFPLVLAPIVEEAMKFLTILVLGKMIQGVISKSETIRQGGAMGLGFGCIEVLGYMISGQSFSFALWRLVTSLPFHLTSSLMISTMLTERKKWLLPSARDGMREGCEKQILNTLKWNDLHIVSIAFWRGNICQNHLCQYITDFLGYAYRNWQFSVKCRRVPIKLT